MLLGERTRLRRIERSDLPRLAGWMNDPAVRENLTVTYPLSLVHETEWFDATLKHEPACQPFLIEAPALSGGIDEWVPIGCTGFHTLAWRTRVAEFGIVLGDRTVWGKGYGTDAARTLIRWAFSELNFNRIWLRVFEENARAIRSYEKLGFKVEGRLRQDHFHEGHYSDTIVMGLLRDELR